MEKQRLQIRVTVIALEVKVNMKKLPRYVSWLEKVHKEMRSLKI